MTERSIAIQIGDEIIIPEFQAFERNEFVRYLRNLNHRYEWLTERRDALQKHIQELAKRRKAEHNPEIQELLSAFAYKNQASSDEMIFGGTPYNPDTLHKLWEKVFGSFESEEEEYENRILSLMYEQVQAECVYRCIDLLPFEQKILVTHVYVEREKVRDFCRERQIGHDTYNNLKNSALQALQVDCNFRLDKLYRIWKKSYEENTMVPGFAIPYGRPAQIVSGA